MKFKLANLAKLLEWAVERGYGDLVVSAELPFDITVLRGRITPAEVKRDEHGRWRHPATPERWDIPMGEWLRELGFDFATTLLIRPDDATDTTNLSDWQYTAPNGDRWFLWEINVNADGTPVAVWIAPTK